ncbi:MAG: molybdopterin dehydrogenase FAD-binding protein [Burkholderiaceae bacterium]|nr:molybdopterin dehydrogenase FAD-binding protein [Burkholderiaceae bacterium]
MSAVLLPDSFEALWEAFEAYPQARLFAGGTDLLVHRHTGRAPEGDLIGLERMGELKGVRQEGDFVLIGAATPVTRLMREPLLADAFPVLTSALATIGGPALRNMATLGGNVCTASPAGDSLPALYVLEAEVVLQSRRQQRQLPIREFITGPGRIALQPGEIVSAIRLRRDHGYTVQHFEKVGQRQAHAISIVSLAVCATLASDRTVTAIRCAWGSVGPTIIESDAVQAALFGRRLDEATLADAAKVAMQAVSPIDDIRASAVYRRQLAGNLLYRLLG